MSNYSDNESCQRFPHLDDYSPDPFSQKLDLYRISPSTTVRNDDPKRITDRFDLDDQSTNQPPTVLFAFQIDNREVPLWTLDQRMDSNPSQKKKQKHKYPRACEACGSIFTTHEGFGGHNAKVHPRQSETYNHKKLTEKLRVLKRKRGEKLEQIINKYIH